MTQADRLEAIRVVTNERDRLVGYRAPYWAMGKARDLHRVIEVLAHDAGVQVCGWAELVDERCRP